MRSSALWATLVALSSRNLPSLTWNWDTFSVRGMTKSSSLIEPLEPAACQQIMPPTECRLQRFPGVHAAEEPRTEE